MGSLQRLAWSPFWLGSGLILGLTQGMSRQGHESYAGRARLLPNQEGVPWWWRPVSLFGIWCDMEMISALLISVPSKKPFCLFRPVLSSRVDWWRRWSWGMTFYKHEECLVWPSQACCGISPNIKQHDVSAPFSTLNHAWFSGLASVWSLTSLPGFLSCCVCQGLKGQQNFPSCPRVPGPVKSGSCPIGRKVDREFFLQPYLSLLATQVWENWDLE